ncbi:crystal protein-like [Ptychodera flava]|uniref:crystal protein-like n=1 Tax=Ptychodera flava TaxID=63121 RepID=UPI00396A245B
MSPSFLILTLLTFAATSFMHVVRADGPLVHTKYGAVRGVYVDGASVFYGIPYAKPPTGTRRWQDAQPIDSWSPKILQATTPPPACPQNCVLPPGMCVNKTDEDCLFMTIHAPLTAKPSSSLPVMAYIFGGNYIQGSGYNLLQDGRYLVNYTNVILAEFNYRIGALGFLVTGEGEGAATGNYAIRDQRFALQWIRENIAAFGGDPNSVTIFGESSGAESVSIHLISEKSSDLFNRAIIQSHPFGLPYRRFADAVVLGAIFAKHLNCSPGDTECMKTKTVEEILQAQTESATKIINPLRLLELFQAWGPLVGGSDLPKQPVDSFAAGEYNKKPVMIGSTSDEGRLDLFEAYTSAMSKTQYYETIIADFRLRAIEVLAKFPPSDSKDQRDLLSLIGHQYMFFCPERIAARGISTHSGDVYMYVFNHTISFDAWGANYSFCVGHPCHGSELPFLFHSAPLGGFKFTKGEEVLSRSLMTYWTNFASTGDPNKRGEKKNSERGDFIEWPKYDNSTNWQYLHFLTPNRIGKNYLDHECNFWDFIRYYP